MKEEVAGMPYAKAQEGVLNNMRLLRPLQVPGVLDPSCRALVLADPPALITPVSIYEQDNAPAFFFFGRTSPEGVLGIVDWFFSLVPEIFRANLSVHLGSNLPLGVRQSARRFSGWAIGLWLLLAPGFAELPSAVMKPYIKGFNSMPRVVVALAPIPSRYGSGPRQSGRRVAARGHPWCSSMGVLHRPTRERARGQSQP